MDQTGDIAGDTVALADMEIRSAVVPGQGFSTVTRKTTHVDIQEPIAVIGMACRLPGANNPTEFWNLLMDESPDGMKPRKFRSQTEKPSNEENTNFLPMHYLSVPVDEIDNHLFGLNPATVHFLDPQTRILLEVAWEALEDSGTDPTSLRGSKTGVFTGAYTDDHKGFLNQESSLAENYFQKYMGSIGGCAARLAHIFGATGPCYASDAACTSSMVSIHLACQTLRLRETELALACGVNLLLQPFTADDMGGTCSPDGVCKTFDAEADGYARAEGCAVLILKRVSDAVRDGDRIHGLIRGTAVVQEGTTTSLMKPTVSCEVEAMMSALANAGISPSEVSYLEAHGTGTVVGDPIEMAAISEVYSTPRIQSLVIASVKTNIGHTESCSGITGIIKTLLAFKHELIPKHKNFRVLNPKINLKDIPAVIPLENVAWPRISGTPRFAGVNCFGITGSEAHAVLQEPPLQINKTNSSCDRPSHILSLSAQTPQALETAMLNYEKYLESETADLGDICYSGNTGRSQRLQHRAAVIGSNVAELGNNIAKNKIITGKAPPQKPKLCFAFPGLGCLYDGMGTEFYLTCPAFRSRFNECDSHLRKRWNMSLVNYVNGSELTTEENRLILEGQYSQTLIFVVEYSLLKTLEDWGIKPDVVLGHSVGEMAACVAAEVMTMQAALNALVERNTLTAALTDDSMLVVNLSKDEIAKLFSEFNNSELDFAAINSESQTVIGGNFDRIGEFADICRNNGTKHTFLKTKQAYHTRQMEAVSQAVRDCFAKYEYRKPTCHYISGLLGRALHEHESIDADYFLRHLRDTVRFLDASLAAFNSGCRIFLEVGPAPILSAIMESNYQHVEDQSPVTFLPCFRKNSKDWATMLGTLANLHINGFDINWKNFDNLYNRSLVNVPHYPFQRKQFPIPGPRPSGVLHFQNGTRIHPLLGHFLPNASEVKIFQGTISISTLSYLGDHVIGEQIIFPGAGFLEMTLAAGILQLNPEESTPVIFSQPISVSNFVIESPLAICGNVQVQVIVCPTSDRNTSMVKVFSYETDETSKQSKWIEHASGTFCRTRKSNLNSTTVEQHLLEDRLINEYNANIFYNEAQNVGLKYGAHFKSLSKVWKHVDRVVAEILVPEHSNPYFLHPIITDGMIQAALVNAAPENYKELRVPIAVNSFTFYKKPTGKSVFVLAYKINYSQNVLLFNSENQLLASMEGITFAKTSVEIIEKQSNRHEQSKTVKMYDTEWRATLGSLEQRMEELQTVFTMNNIFPREMLRKYAASNPFSEKEERTFKTVNDLCYFYILRAFQQLGWKPKIGEILNSEDFCRNFGIKDSFLRLVHGFLSVLCEEGLLKNMDSDFAVVKSTPSEDQVSEHIDTLLSTLGFKTVNEYGPLDTIVKCGLEISNVLKGTAKAQELLFTAQTKSTTLQTSAELFYETHPVCIKLDILLKESFTQSLKGFLLRPQRGILRVLEVGSGTGSGTQSFLPILKEHLGTSFIYTFTDISPSFFPKAQQKFQKYKNQMEFKIFDLEKDPLDQGFWPGQFDVILGLNVFHICKRLQQCVLNLRILTTDFGLLSIMETTKPLRDVDITFGLFEDYWLFEDLDLRPRHCLITSKQWKGLLKVNGYDFAASLSSHHDYCSVIMARAGPILRELDIVPNGNKVVVLFSDTGSLSQYIYKRLQLLGKTVCRFEISEISKSEHCHYWVRHDDKSLMETALLEIIGKYGAIEHIVYLWGDVNITDQSMISQPLLYLSQILQGPIWTKPPKLTISTQGLSCIGDYEIDNPSSATITGMMKVLQNEVPNLKCKIIDIDPNGDNPVVFNELFNEIWNTDREFTVAYRNGKRYVPRLTECNSANQLNALTLPNSRTYTIALPSTKHIKDLAIIPAPRPIITDNSVEVEVKAIGLNFKDVLIVLKPSPEFDSIKNIGLEFAGVVTSIGSKVTNTKVGDAVCGWEVLRGTFQSHISVPSHQVMTFPTTWTFSDAATLTIAFRTAYYCLVIVGDLKCGETVLIHTGSGAVGLCSIQLARHLGAKVITTAGSSRKRAYLRNLGLEHVFNSRTLDFGADVLEVTGGKGVDMVLNSLTGPGLKETSLKVSAPSARFIEMSKLDIWNVDDVGLQRPDVKYAVVDVTFLPHDVDLRIVQKMVELMDTNVITPLPYSQFDFVNTPDALEYLKMAKHIGKVVVEMPVFEVERGVPCTYLFNERSTYLITGGFGGIGLEVAQWMANSGAKYIALVGRSEPSATAQDVIKSMISAGKVVTCLTGDVGDIEQCRNVLDQLKSNLSLPPVRGIMHCAGIFESGTIKNTTWSNFVKILNPKVNGAWNLHNLTKDGPHLEHFVLFSSVMSTLGFPGLSSHAAGNSFLDALAHHRNSIGLPALSVNWGQWAQIGVVAGANVPGLKPLQSLQAIKALETLLKSYSTQKFVSEIDFSELQKLYPNLGLYLEDVMRTNVRVENTVSQKYAIDAGGFSAEFKDSEEKYGTILKHLDFLMNLILMFDQDEIGKDECFQNLGFDSLMFVQLRNSLGLLIPNINTRIAGLIFEEQTLAGLASDILIILNANIKP